jgi:hypothetical protein
MTYDIPALQDYSGDTAPEHKSGIAARGDYDDFRITFEEFKAANDERLARLEKKRGDVLLEEKVDRINAALDAQARRMDDLALKHARPVLEGRGRIVSVTGSRSRRGKHLGINGRHSRPNDRFDGFVAERLSSR